MEKIGIKLLKICLIFMLLTTTISCNRQDELRLRIIANSDSYVDQQNKEIVKDAIKKIYEKNSYIDVKIIKTELKEYLNDELYSEIFVELKNENFPAKSYKGKIIPSGIYPSIVITIGEGRGKNFWTMLYPEFFNISFEDENEIEYHSYIYDKITN